MAKAHSPLRLEANLVAQAKISGEQLHRSTAEQIEYWADLGRKISRIISPETIMQVHAGVVQVKIEPVISPNVDPDQLFNALEKDRESGELQRDITSSVSRYQASIDYPGYLEKVSMGGEVIVGQFIDGRFCPRKELIVE